MRLPARRSKMPGAPGIFALWKSSSCAGYGNTYAAAGPARHLSIGVPMSDQAAFRPATLRRSNPPRRVLVVGGVAGGASCAARLRRLDESVEIALFDRGPFV